MLPSYTASSLHVLTAPHALDTFTRDLKHPGSVYAWVYLLDPPFAEKLFADHLAHSELFFLIDNRQRKNVSTLVDAFPRFHAWSWAYNRTLHAKTFLFPQLGVTWISSQNLTLGSFNLSYNHAARIHSPPLTLDLLTDWADHRLHSKIVPARQIVRRLHS